MKDEGLGKGFIVFIYMCLFCIATIYFLSIQGQLSDIQAQLDAGGQVYAEKLQALRIENTALEEENEMLRNSYNDMTGDIMAAIEILDQISYEEIAANPGGVDLWLRIVSQTLGGK